jgi:hypothetical protein
MKAIVNSVANALPDAPLDIINGAKRIGNAKNTVLPKNPTGLLDKIDTGLQDIGSVGGVGLTAAGAALNKSLGSNKVGRALKRTGVSRVVDPKAARTTGAIMLGAASIPGFMGVNELSKKLNGSLDLESMYGVDPTTLA